MSHLQYFPAVLEAGHARVPGTEGTLTPALQGHEHQVDPRPGVPRLHRVESCLVQTVLPPALAGEVQLGVLLPFAFLYSELYRKGQLDIDTLHVGLDLVQVLLTEVLHSVTHGEGLEDADPVAVLAAFPRLSLGLRDVSPVTGGDTGDVMGPTSEGR